MSTLGLLGVLAIFYAAIPALAAFVLPRLLVSSGVSASHFSIGYPGWRGVDIDSFEMRIGDVAVAGERGHVAYGIQQLLQGRCDAVTLARLTVRLGSEQTAPTNAPFQLPSFWALVPAQRVSIDQIDFASVSPAAEAHGTLHFDPDVLEAHLNVASPLLAIPLLVSATTFPDGRLAMAITQSDVAEPLLALTGVPDAKRGVLTIDGHVALGGMPLTLAAAYAHMTLDSGTVAVDFEGSAPWPLPRDAAWRRFGGQGRYAIALQGQMPQVPDAFAQLHGAFVVHDGTVAAQVDAGSVVRAVLPALRAFTGHDVPRLTLSADAAVAVDYTEAGVRVGDGLVVAAPVAGSAVSVRARGARGADGHMELVVTTLDGAPVVLATTRAADAAGVLAIHAQAALAGKLFRLVAGGFGVAGAAGHLVAEFDGSVPRSSGAADVLQNVSGKGRVTLAATGRVGATRTFDAAIEGECTLERGRLSARIAPGAHVLLAADGIEATTIGAIAIDALLDQPRTDVQGLDFKLALPVIEVGERKVVLDDAWVTAEHLSRNGDAVVGELIVRTHAGRDAQPIHVSFAHDLAKGVGRFVIAADWQAKKPLLAAQLPGFQAPYDLDEGTLRVDIKGDWAPDRQPAVRGAGHVQLAAQRAHYEDSAIGGVAADLPVTFDGEAYAVATTPVSIDTVDVGFPLTHIALNLAVANKIAQVRDLHGSVLGGNFAADTFAYALATDTADILVRIAAIDLAQVLALEGEDVQGSGVLDGELPIRLDGDVVTVTDGTLAARAPGGTLRYKGAASSSLAAQSGMGFVFQALEDFRFDVLDAKVALATDGALVLAVRLQGHNPAVEDGRSIAFNLNLNESLPALLQSLRAAEGITKRIEGKLSQ